MNDTITLTVETNLKHNWSVISMRIKIPKENMTIVTQFTSADYDDTSQDLECVQA